MNLSTERVRANGLPSVMFDDLQITIPYRDSKLTKAAFEIRRYSVFTPGSIVLLPMRRAWWSTSEKRMAERLRKLGHTVIWVEV